MELFEAIDKRYSYRGRFGPEGPSTDELRRILAAGAAAPSGMNGQSASFVAVTDAGKINAIADVMSGNPAVATAGALIVVTMDPQATAHRGFTFGVEDYAAAVENMLLAVTALGYATVWIDGALRRDNRAERIAELLAIPPSLPVRVLLPVGRPVEEGPRKDKKPLAERAYLNRWGAGV